MESLEKNNYLFKIAPSLVREWHPTANGKLTPRNLEVAYSKRVWWICSVGHEWQSTIQYRMNRTNCPVCENEGVRNETEETLNIPLQKNNRRKKKRFKATGIVVIEIPNTGHWVYSELKNLSHRGLCIETDSAISPGSAIRVKIDKDLVSSRLTKSHPLPSTNGYKTYNSIVKWYKRLDDEQSNSSINIGLELK